MLARQEAMLRFNESISDCGKRSETENGLTFRFGEGFDCSGDAELVEDVFKLFTAKLSDELIDGLLLDITVLPA